MPNVIVHQYEGTDPYCERCQLPRKNDAHQPDNTILIMLTFPNGQSEEHWTKDFTPMELSSRITELLDEPYQPRCDVCGVHTEEADGWCGNCGNCMDHCEQHMGCPPREGDTE